VLEGADLWFARETMKALVYLFLLGAISVPVAGVCAFMVAWRFARYTVSIG